ncbi:MAG: ferredoxin family protein [Actinobacteria bacterium]|nr:ferredoxin family protein [Actinomycetota bacterium]
MPDSSGESNRTGRSRDGTGNDGDVALAGRDPSATGDDRPTDKGRSKKRKPSEIVIYRDWCKACGICIEFCPTRVFEVGEGGEPIVAHPEECISCDLCELLCPDFAITLHRVEVDE